MTSVDSSKCLMAHTHNHPKAHGLTSLAQVAIHALGQAERYATCKGIWDHCNYQLKDQCNYQLESNHQSQLLQVL